MQRITKMIRSRRNVYSLDKVWEEGSTFHPCFIRPRHGAPSRLSVDCDPRGLLPLGKDAASTKGRGVIKVLAIARSGDHDDFAVEDTVDARAWRCVSKNAWIPNVFRDLKVSFPSLLQMETPSTCSMP